MSAPSSVSGSQALVALGQSIQSALAPYLPKCDASSLTWKLKGATTAADMVMGNSWATVQTNAALGGGLEAGPIMRAQPNATGAGVGVSWRRNNGNAYRADVIADRSDGLRSLERQPGESNRPTKAMAAVEGRELAAMEPLATWTSKATTFNTRLPLPGLPGIIPRGTRTVKSEEEHRVFADPAHVRSRLTGDGGKTASVLPAALGTIADLTTPCPLATPVSLFGAPAGDRLLRKEKTVDEVGANLSTAYGYVGAQFARIQECESRVESKGKSEVVAKTTASAGTGWRLHGGSLFGLRATHRTTTQDTCQLTDHYTDSPSARGALQDSLAQLHLVPQLPSDPVALVNLAEAMAQANQGHAGIKREKVVLKREKPVVSLLQFELRWLPYDQTSLIPLKVERLDAFRQIAERTERNGNASVILRDEWTSSWLRNVWGWGSNAHTVNVNAEWMPAVAGDGAEAAEPTFLGINITAVQTCGAKENLSTSKTTRNSFNKYFGPVMPEVQPSVYQGAAGGKIEVKAKLSPQHVVQLTGDLIGLGDADFEALTDEIGIEWSAAHSFREAMVGCTTVQQQCDILRQFISRNGLAAMGFVYRTLQAPDKSVEPSADAGVYAETIANASRVLRDYPEKIHADTPGGPLYERLRKVASGLRDVALALHHRQTNFLLHNNAEELEQSHTDLQRARQTLRNCISIDHLSASARARIRKALLDLPNRDPDCKHGAALFVRSADIDALAATIPNLPLTRTPGDAAPTTTQAEASRCLRTLTVNIHNNVLLSGAERKRRLTRASEHLHALGLAHFDSATHINPSAYAAFNNAPPAVERVANTSFWQVWNMFFAALSPNAWRQSLNFWPSASPLSFGPIAAALRPLTF